MTFQSLIPGKKFQPFLLSFVYIAWSKPTVLKIMNALRPDKLLHSKWTAVTPQNKERHFIVSNITDNKRHLCQIEAVLTKRKYNIDWQSLRDQSLWQAGWK